MTILFFKLAVSQMKKEKSRSISVFFVIFLASFLLISLFSLYQSYLSMLLLEAYDNNGEYHLYIENIDNVEIVNREEVSLAGLQSEAESAEIKAVNGQYLQKGESGLITFMDQTAMELAGITLMKGKFPSKENEILLSSSAKAEGEYIYKQIDFGKNKQQGSITIFFQGVQEEFTIVGILDDYNAGKTDEGVEMIGLQKKIEFPATAYLELKNPSRYYIRDFVESLGYDYETQVYDIALLREQGDVYKGDYPIVLNNYVLNLLNGGESEEGIYIVRLATLGITFMILLIAGMMIGGVYAIDLEFRKKETALLRICGCSKIMVLQSVLQKVFLQAIMAYSMAVFFLVALKGFLQKMISLSGTRFSNLQLSFQPKIFFIILCFILFLVFISVILPVIRQNFQEPAEAIHQKTGQGRQRIDGKFIVMVISLSVCVSFFIVFLGIRDIMYEKSMEISEEYRSQFYLISEEITELKKLQENIPYVSEFDTLYDKIEVCNLGEESWNQKLDFLCQQSVAGESQMYIEICGISKDFYIKYLKGVSGKLPSYEELLQSEGGILNDTACIKDEGKYHMEQLLSLKEGDYVECSMKEDTNGRITILGRAMFSDKKYQIENEYDLIIFLPIKTFEKHFDSSLTLCYVNAIEGKEQQLKEWLRDNKDDYGIFVSDYTSEYQMQQDTGIMTEMLLFYILVLITLVSMFHIGNTVLFRIETKKTEYSLLRVLGAELRTVRLISCREAVLAAMLSCLIGIFLGNMVLKKTMELFMQIHIVSVSVPIWYIMVAIIGTLFLSIITAFIVSGTLKKYSIVDGLGDSM